MGLCTTQALYGILQYVGFFPAIGGFRITGSFDNPAGFAACLCAGFPVFFFFIRKKYVWQRWLSLTAIIILCIAVVLSASRAGMISLIVVCLALIVYKFPINAKLKLTIVSLTFALALSGLYFLKKDSADGRLLIWRCSWEMIKDKPLFGHEHGGFKAHYMDYQADYFAHHSDSRYEMLADNVNRPFNEYLLLLTDYGLVGFVLLLALIGVLWISFHRNRHKSILVRIAAGSLLSIGVFSFFSYPLVYPFVWVMGIASIAVIIYQAKYQVKIPSRIGPALKLIMIPVIFIFGLHIYQRMTTEMLWCKVAHQSLLGKTEEMLPVYEQLHKSLTNNELFLYNYAAELNVIKQYDKSLEIALECERLLADYDLQMLMADNYQNLQNNQKAEYHYKKASNMCPVKFMPIYQLVELYNEAGRKEEALTLAQKIIDKDVKIPSATISIIKQKMRQLIEKSEAEKVIETKSVPAPQSRTSDQPQTIEPGLGGFSDAPYATRPP
jgi:tetratricopeptide (TPR) repeat protein